MKMRVLPEKFQISRIRSRLDELPSFMKQSSAKPYVKLNSNKLKHKTKRNETK